MPITTISGANSGVLPTVSLYKVGGLGLVGTTKTLWGTTPNAGAYDTTLNGVTLTAPVTGQISLTNPASGNTYLHRMQSCSASTNTGTVWMYDRLWHNGGINVTSTGAQGITSPTWPARDANGSTNGVGVLLAVEVSATMGAATPTITISYTNSSGTAGRTATNIKATAANAPAGTVYEMSLDSGDVGVRSIQSITLSASWVSGTINIVAYRPIGFNVIRYAGFYGETSDVITGGFPRIYDNSVLYLAWQQTVTTSSTTIHNIQFAQG